MMVTVTVHLVLQENTVRKKNVSMTVLDMEYAKIIHVFVKKIITVSIALLNVANGIVTITEFAMYQKGSAHVFLNFSESIAERKNAKIIVVEKDFVT